mgnify:CR=1 FL=1
MFNKENPETIIFKFKKGQFKLKNEKIKLLNITTRKAIPSEIYKKALEALNNKISNEVFDYSEVPHYLNSEPWSSFFIDVPDFPSVKLKDLAKVGVGLVSGFDKGFILKEDILKLNDKEKTLIKNFVKAKNCRRFIVDGVISYILIDDSINSESTLKQDYPNIYKKLIKYKEEMLGRYLPKNKKWFNWQALRNYKFLMSNINKKRIYVPTLDRHPYNRFSLGNENLLPSGDVLFIQPYKEKDLYFLLGFLNSTFFRKYYLAHGGRRGGRISFTQKLLENAKIPLFSTKIKNKINDISLEIISRLKNNKDISDKERELDALIYNALENRKFKKNILL